MGVRLRQGVFYVVLAACVVCLYLWAAARMGEIGFPLDDAWIHQTYARNLAETGRWEYIQGQTSAGSTAPLWTWMLSWGYRLGISYRFWTLGLGIIFLGLSGLLTRRLAKLIVPNPPWVANGIGILCIFEWHLVWAAASGMETVLYIFISLGLLKWMADSTRWMEKGRSYSLKRLIGQGFALGGLAGLLVLTRPEGILLVGITGLWILYNVLRKTLPLNSLVWLAGGALFPIVFLLLPYILFNLGQSGHLWPNTFYAKQAEYAASLQANLVERFYRVVFPVSVGYQILLVPGIFLAGWKIVVSTFQFFFNRQANDKANNTNKIPLVFCSFLLTYFLVYSSLYALRLPVAYQHGRYMIPLIPSLLILGTWGMMEWFELRSKRIFQRLASQTWLASLIIVAFVFYGIGANAYANDTQVIQKEMVTVAKWLSEHTDPGEWIAAHDIGAIGYFSNRPILDLAGLISPQVVPYLGDESKLESMILQSQAHYLVTAPGWPFSSLTNRPDVILLFEADSAQTRASGLNNSAVYALPVR